MKVWTTKDGIEIPYDQLKFSHIYNIIRYAQRNGFFTIYTSHSTVDNTDDITRFEDCSKEVIREMRAELKRRNIAYAYYVEMIITCELKKVSPAFESREKACEWAFNAHWPRERCNIVKEYMH